MNCDNELILGLHCDNLPTITYEQFLEMNKEQDLCFLYKSGRVHHDLRDAFEDLDDDFRRSAEDFERIIHNCKALPVFKKRRWHISEDWITDNIIEELENLGYDEYDNGELASGKFDTLIKDFVNNFNLMSSGYSSYGDPIALLDVRVAAVEYGVNVCKRLDYVNVTLEVE